MRCKFSYETEGHISYDRGVPFYHDGDQPGDYCEKTGYLCPNEGETGYYHDECPLCYGFKSEEVV